MRDSNEQVDMAQSHRAARLILRNVGVDPENLPWTWKGGELFGPSDRRIATQIPGQVVTGSELLPADAGNF